MSLYSFIDNNFSKAAYIYANTGFIILIIAELLVK